MKDLFWKIFAITALIVINGMFYLNATVTRYTIQNKSLIMDRWTGRVYQISDRLMKRPTKTGMTNKEIAEKYKHLNPSEDELIKTANQGK
jgi:predicted MPP superfamily phosphohydrolase